MNHSISIIHAIWVRSPTWTDNHFTMNSQLLPPKSSQTIATQSFRVCFLRQKRTISIISIAIWTSKIPTKYKINLITKQNSITIKMNLKATKGSDKMISRENTATIISKIIIILFPKETVAIRLHKLKRKISGKRACRVKASKVSKIIVKSKWISSEEITFFRNSMRKKMMILISLRWDKSKSRKKFNNMKKNSIKKKRNNFLHKKRSKNRRKRG